MESIGLLAIAGSYLFLKATTLYVTIGDQNLWFYASLLWSQGVVPYRDFFLSHPPLHILISTIAVMLGGMNLPMLLALPSVFGLLSGLLLYVLTRRAFGGAGALLAFLLFLFSHRHLLASSYFTGINLALFFLLLGIELRQEGRVLLAGIVLGLGAASGVYIGVGALILILIAVLDDRSRALKLGAAFATTFGLTNLISLVIAGPDFLHQVYAYHLAKPGESAFFPAKSVILMQVFRNNVTLVVLTLCAIPLFLRELGRRGGPGSAEQSTRALVQLSLAMLAGHAMFLMVLSRVFTHYALLFLPFAVIATTYVVMRLLLWWPSVVRLRRGYTIAAWVLVVVLLAHTIGTSVRKFLVERELRRFDGEREIADYIASTLKQGETIYGDVGIVPLLAALSDRRVAANEIESNIMRFESGTSSLARVIEVIEEDNVAMVISRPGRGIVVYPPFGKYLREKYVRARRFEGEQPWTTVDVWVRR